MATKVLKRDKWITPKEEFPAKWRKILVKRIPFYNRLNADEQNQFEFQAQEFLLNCKVTGVQTEVTDEDRLLVASAAVIPIFAFPEWKYYDLFEVLLYPSAFNEKFEIVGKDRFVLGMVGTGYMDGKMILSKPSLDLGFRNESDKKNTAIHEFIHIIDKVDGEIDGIPKVLLDKQYVVPWLDLIQKKTAKIHESESDINPYGGTSQTEFLSVASEYFFERPKFLKSKHPELYKSLSEMFQQDLANRSTNRRLYQTSRNAPCICGSGIKYKKCCG